MASGKELTDDDRDYIMMAVARNESFRDIASYLGRHHSVISREVGRHGGRENYRARAATNRAVVMRARPKTRQLEKNPRLRDAVAEGLAAGWSPQQVSRRLVGDHPGDGEMRVSHETVYETLFVQARGECRTQLRLTLRSGRVQRKARGTTRPRAARIADMVNISERPAEAADRAVPGHWESDLVIGEKGRSQVLTLVERTTRFVILQKIPYDRTAERVALKLTEAVGRLPQELWRTGHARPGRGDGRARPGSPSPRVSRSTSAIRTRHGSAAPTRTPTDFCGSTCRRGPTFPCTAKKRSTTSPPGSTAVHAIR